jgi:hypothetical protein
LLAPLARRPFVVLLAPENGVVGVETESVVIVQVVTVDAVRALQNPESGVGHLAVLDFLGTPFI